MATLTVGLGAAGIVYLLWKQQNSADEMEARYSRTDIAVERAPSTWAESFHTFKEVFRFTIQVRQAGCTPQPLRHPRRICMLPRGSSRPRPHAVAIACGICIYRWWRDRFFAPLPAVHGSTNSSIAHERATYLPPLQHRACRFARRKPSGDGTLWTCSSAWPSWRSARRRRTLQPTWQQRGATCPRASPCRRPNG